MKKLLLIAGTRPNFIKLAPLYHQFKHENTFNVKICHTGQHFDTNMSDVFWKALSLPTPDFQLNIKGANVNEIIGKSLIEINNLLIGETFDGVVVFGDVNATIAGALAAAQSGIPVFHVESGLRSFDRTMPEEVNRVITDHISNLLFVSEPSGIINLKHEGIASEKTFLVGNIMIECLLNTKPIWQNINLSTNLKTIATSPYIIATFHRPENVDFEKNLTRVIEILSSMAKNYKVILPLHPRTKNKLDQFKLFELLNKNENICLTEPLPYFEFLNLLNNCHCVITDSGGVQEESSFLGKPCITFRNNTERPVTITNGTNKLASIWDEDFFENMQNHIESIIDLPKNNIQLWDNKVSKRILTEIENFYKQKQ